MDELRLNLTTKFMKNVVTRFIAAAIQKKMGYNIDIQLNEVNIVAVDGKIHFHANMDAETTNEEFTRIVKSIGLD